MANAILAWWHNIDWAATGNWMQAWAGFLGAFAVIYAARKGAATFREWLRQRQTERRIETAEKALDVAYRLQRAFEAIRSPGYFGSAGPNAEKVLREAFDDFDRLDDDRRGRLTWAQIVLTRIHSFQADWDRLFDCLPIARAHFGAAVYDSLRVFWLQQAIVNGGAQSYGRPQLAADFRATLEARIWEGAGEPDQVKLAVDQAVSDLETKLLPILRSEVEEPA